MRVLRVAGLAVSILLGAAPVSSQEPSAAVPGASADAAHAAGLMTDGYMLLAQNTSSALHDAIARFQSALLAWQALGEKSRQVEALLAMARGNFLLHDPGESAALLARADNVARATGEPEQLATVLVSLALLHQATGASAQALDEAREAGGLYQSLGKLDAEATVRLTEAQLLFTLQDMPAAVTAYQHSLSLFRSSGTRSGEAIALLGAGTASGMLHNAQGYAQAADYLAQAVPLLEANPRRQSQALLGLAKANDELGRPQLARDAYASALNLFAQPDDRRARAITLYSLARDEQILHNLAKARDAYEQALPLFETLGDELNRGNSLMRLGGVREELGDDSGALSAYADAANAWAALNDASSEAIAKLKIGVLHARTQAWQPALEADGAALRIAEAAGARAQQAIALNAIADVYQRQGDWRHARGAALRSAGLFEGDPQHRASALLTAGNAAVRLRDHAAALHDLDEVIALGTQDSGTTTGALAAEAEIYLDMADPQKALDLLQRAGSIQRDPDEGVANRVRNDIALAYVKLGRMDDALANYQTALKAARASGDLQQLAAILSNLAQLRQAFGDTRLAVELFQQALEAARKAGDREVEGIVLASLGMAYHELADDTNARAALDRALVIARTLGNLHQQAVDLSDLALVYSEAGALQLALDTYDQAQGLLSNIESPYDRAGILSNIGSVYSALGATDRARSYFEQARAIDEQIGDDVGLALQLNNLAVLEQKADQPAKALPLYQQSLALARKLGNRPAQARLLSSIGVMQSQEGRHDQALQMLGQSRDIAQETGSVGAEAYATHNLGTEYSEMGELTQAAEIMQKALALWRQTRDVAGEATALAVIGRIEARQGDLSAALDHAQQSIQLSETQRSQIASEDLKATLLARASGAYALKIAILMRLDQLHPSAGYAARALETSERARARSLIDLLTQSRADLHRDPEKLSRMREIERAMSAKAIQRAKLSSAGPNAAAAARLDHEIDELQATHDEIEVEIRAVNPSYAALTQPHPLALAEIQQLLEPGTLLLEYALGDRYSEHGTVWAVTRSDMRAYPLPARDVVLAAMRSFQKALPDVADPGSFDDASAKLGAMLLGPVSRELGSQRLIVVSDGELQAAVPFAALTAPGQHGQRRLLVLDHEVIEEPSASAVAALRAGSQRRARPHGTVAVLADAVFSSSDPRLAAKAQAGRSGMVQAISRVVADQELPRLPGTRLEARSILALTSAAHSLVRFGFDASKAAAEDPALARYRIVHFATHGLLNQHNPALSGLVFSLFRPDGTGQDGYLRLNDVFNLALPVDLVVLSACDSGQGKQVGGEGLIGLTRGFFYAGAASLLVTLWTADDQATAPLMARLYSKMLGRDHLRPAAALRRAQIKMLRGGKWRHPWFWAPFIAEGEWR